jgi:hypothetical protein
LLSGEEAGSFWQENKEMKMREQKKNLVSMALVFG